MKRHLEAEYSHLNGKDQACFFFNIKADVCKRRKLDDQKELHTTSYIFAV